MRQFLGGDFDAVVFDEGDWKLAIENKALFQSSLRPVMLSQSQCNESAYQVSTHGSPMIVTSNAFWDGCPQEASDWIMANSFFVQVSQPLFLA